MVFDDVRMKKVCGTGSLPEFGAIFMSNKNTKEECFSRRLFGLPFSSADFVRRVRAGMVLFLFEYEQRKLYGVFEAISDGAIDTVPQAYLSSGKLFPAQVQFSPIWKCRPLPEHEFCNAIKDNYYASNKFHFGLSKEQVYRLLCLFESAKIRVDKTLRRKVKKSCSRSSDERYGFGGTSKLIVETNDFTVGNSESSRVYLSRGSPNLFSHGEPEQVNISSNNASFFLDRYIPLPSSHHSDNVKALSDNSPKVKGLYSDSSHKRESAFSRLSLVPEIAEKKEKTQISEIPERALKGSKKNFEADDSVYEIMEKLQQRHDNWRITKKNAGDDNISLNKRRSSIFTRLSYTSQATEPMKNKIKEKSSKDRKKRKRVRKVKVVNIRDRDYENDNSSSDMTTIQVTIQGRDGKMSESRRGGSVWLPADEEDHKKKKRRRISSYGSSAAKENDDMISENETKVKMVASELRRVIHGEESNEEEKSKGLTNADSNQLGDDHVVPIPFKTYQQQHRHLSASPSCVKYAGIQVVVDVAKVERFEASCVDIEEGECCEEDAEQELEFFL